MSAITLKKSKMLGTLLVFKLSVDNIYQHLISMTYPLSLGIFQPCFFLPTDAALFPLRYNYYRYVPSRRLLCHEHQAYVDARLSHSMVNLPLIDDDYGDWPMLGDAPHSAILRCWSMFIHCLSHYIYISLSLVSTTWRHSSTKAVDIWPQQ